MNHLTLAEYQERSKATAIYPKDCGINYCIHGLTNEAGEVAGVWKKYLRGDYGIVDATSKVKKEIGDVLWYVSQLAGEFNLSLADIAQANIDKLADRKQRGVIAGDGDNR
jgi:NTP pyrophosphatase (non-canonical NTP hydrolase)